MELSSDLPYGLVGATLLFGFALLSSYVSARNRRAKLTQASLYAEALGQDTDQTSKDDLQARMAELEDENARLERELEHLRESLDRATSRRTDQPASVEVLYKRILGLEPSEPLSAQKLKTAFRSSVKRHHPDRGGDEASLRLVMEAHDYLQARVAA